MREDAHDFSIPTLRQRDAEKQLAQFKRQKIILASIVALLPAIGLIAFSLERA